MSTGPQAKTELSPVFGLHPATFDRYLRDLGEAGLLRRSGKGGGKAAVHLNDLEYARIFLAMGAIHPGGAASAVKALAKLMPEPVPGAGSLITELASTIGLLARVIRSGGDAAAALNTRWALTISLDPLLAWISLQLGDGSEIKHYFREDWQVSKTEVLPAIQRLTVISSAALLAVASLCARDGLPSGVLWEPSRPRSTNPENETAAAPGRVAAAIRDQPVRPETGPSNSSDFKGKRDHSQSPSKRRQVTPRVPE